MQGIGRIVLVLSLVIFAGCGGSTKGEVVSTRILVGNTTTTKPTTTTSTITTTTTIDPNVANLYHIIQVRQYYRWIIAKTQARQHLEQAKQVMIGTHGAHSDAWWHGVSICEQGGRNNNFFGYFSIMDGSAGGGKSWGTQVQMANAIIARAGDHAWAQSCVNAGYRASPGG